MLIDAGQFTYNEDESYDYGGAGCADNSLAAYANTDGCEFQFFYHFDGSSYHVELEVNAELEQNAELVTALNEIKKIDKLALTTFINDCIREQCRQLEAVLML